MQPSYRWNGEAEAPGVGYYESPVFELHPPPEVSRWV